MGDDERALIERYDLAESRVLQSDDSKALKWSVGIGFVAAIFAGFFLGAYFGNPRPAILGIPVGIATGYWWLNEKRETIFLRDLIYGRRFKCSSIVDLAKKEAWLEDSCVVLRQVLETAKHWDGVETRPVPVLSKEAAKEIVVRLT